MSEACVRCGSRDGGALTAGGVKTALCYPCLDAERGVDGVAADLVELERSRAARLRARTHYRISAEASGEE